MSKLVYGSKQYNQLKQEALSLCGVNIQEFNAKEQIAKRVEFLKNHLKNTEQKAYVLGISGGVDSFVVGALCQKAVQELRSEGYQANFVAMRLPAGVQKDESDAQMSLDFIKPDKILTVNVGQAANLLSEQGMSSFEKNEGTTLTAEQVDFNKGNIKARLRMVAQYQAAAMYKGLVIGTDHNSENVTGFFTKWGDGACDLIVLNGLNKRQVRALAKEMGAPEKIWNKAPTADLEELNPGKLDDEGFGFEYSKLDDFLEGKEIDRQTEEKIIYQYFITQHKRKPIVSFE